MLWNERNGIQLREYNEWISKDGTQKMEANEYEVMN